MIECADSRLKDEGREARGKEEERLKVEGRRT
jgi:hypothetical protein